MTADPRTEALRTAVDGALGASYPLPLHILTRLRVLLGDEEPVYVDATIESNGRYFSGTIFVLTPTRAIDATFVDAAAPEYVRERTSTVGVSTWPRRDLTAVTIPRCVETPDNLDSSWDDASDDVWPLEGVVELSFGDKGVVRLPLSERRPPGARRALSALLPALLADLGESS